MRLDVLIFGGGALGLWLLDELSRAGCVAILIEKHALGSGQTVMSQGIIHGGVKYSLRGLLHPSSEPLRDMPRIWRECLTGTRQPDLSSARVRSEHCWLWQTQSLRSRVGMLGAKAALSTRPVEVSRDARPDALRNCRGTVARVDEQVIDTRSLIRTLAERRADRLLHAHADPQFDVDEDKTRVRARIALSTNAQHAEDSLALEADHVVLCAGAGNEALSSLLAGAVPGGHAASPMQRRDLHMTLVRGDLPILNGHCIDGAKTRVTVTSDHFKAAHDGSSSNQTIWQVGGQVAEEGVAMSREELITRTRCELLDVLPGMSFEGCMWATYRADRAEAATSRSARPDDVHVAVDGPVITAWPTKLALVPRAVERILSHLRESSSQQPCDLSSDDPISLPARCARPDVAPLPWHMDLTWTDDRSL